MLTALKICLPLLAIWIALCLVCALRVTRRRRTGDGQVAGDPFLHPFGEMPGFTAEQLRRLAPVPRTDDPLRRSFGPMRQCRVVMTGSSIPSGGDSLSRRLLIVPFTNPVRLALRSRDAGSDGSQFPPGPDAARIDPIEVFEGCWRRPRG